MNYKNSKNVAGKGAGRAPREGPMAYQLVGEVTAHQGYDG